MLAFIADIHYALRQLHHASAFTLTAVLAPALGLGANAALFSLFDQVLLRSLLVRDPNRLVTRKSTGKAWEGHTGNHGGGQEAYFSYPMYQDLTRGLRNAQRNPSQPFTGLGALAAALAGVGIYGVLAYSTVGHTREIGIRIALGSPRLAGWSVAAALPFAYGANHLLPIRLFGISPADPLSFLVAILLVAAIAILAALLPSRRAASIDPVIALRTE